LMRQVSTPGDPQFHKFLTPEQFLAKFGPADADVRKVTAALQRYGLSVERASSTTLRATGTPASLEKAFGVTLHLFEVAAQGTVPAYSFHAPLQPPKVPAEVAGLVSAVVGLDTRPQLRPLSMQGPAVLRNAPGCGNPNPFGNPGVKSPIGHLTVKDFAQYYDVQPLYAKGVTGSGRTIGIVTLANFTPSDAFTYWNSLGLTVDSNRITIVNVDGGPGAPSDASGSIETTLDVEQAGGIAPGAKIIVYMSPNTHEGLLDVFAAAVDANTADSLSGSWGVWEWYLNLQNTPVTDPFTGKTVSALQAFHELFVQAAIQGQSLFSGSGDSGAYEVHRDIVPYPPGYSIPLSVFFPASDSAITAVGGTTLPGTQTYGSIVITVPQERVWGWDYLEPTCQPQQTPLACGLFSVGGGGGVSVFFPVPFYQLGISGVQASQPGQAFVDNAVTPPYTFFALPANYRGRNLPDVSFNADPNTGYIIGYTCSGTDYTGCVTGEYSTVPFGGGTSFVGPQLNGVTALLSQSAHQRLGFLNPALYLLADLGFANQTGGLPLRYISSGDNWFYYGRNGYSPAAGLGVIDVAKLAAALGFRGF
jgi:kumamolisin